MRRAKARGVSSVMSPFRFLLLDLREAVTSVVKIPLAFADFEVGRGFAMTEGGKSILDYLLTCI